MPAGEETSPTPPKEGLALAGFGGQTLPFRGPGTLESPSFGGVGEVSSSPFGGVGEVLKVAEVCRAEEGKPGYITANPGNYRFVKEVRDNLKENPTEAEKFIWEYLRNKKTGYKIRRQHIISDFITDFVCLMEKVVIEIDGEIHLQQIERDEMRTRILNELGYQVIRFTNEEVFANVEMVVQKIKNILDQKVYLKKSNRSDAPFRGPGTPASPSFGGVGEVSSSSFGGVGEVPSSPSFGGVGEVKKVEEVLNPWSLPNISSE